MRITIIAHASAYFESDLAARTIRARYFHLASSSEFPHELLNHCDFADDGPSLRSLDRVPAWVPQVPILGPGKARTQRTKSFGRRAEKDSGMQNALQFTALPWLTAKTSAPIVANCSEAVREEVVES
jgi:hypothetical protein